MATTVIFVNPQSHCVAPAQDIPLISNLGSEFQLKPVNFFNALPSLDIIESDDFQACTPQQGSRLFNYTYSDANANYDSSQWTVAQPLSQPAQPPAGPADNSQAASG